MPALQTPARSLFVKTRLPKSKNGPTVAQASSLHIPSIGAKTCPAYVRIGGRLAALAQSPRHTSTCLAYGFAARRVEVFADTFSHNTLHHVTWHLQYSMLLYAY